MKKSILPITLIFIFSLFFFSSSIANAQMVGETLTGHYTYYDPEGDLEGVSLFQWYRDNIAISGATNISYTTTTDDAGKTIVFEVTPVSITGTSPGAPIRSVGIVINAAPASGGAGANLSPSTPSSSSSVISPKSIGSGKTEVTIPMGDSTNIGTVNADGVNILSYVNSKAIFNTSQIADTHSVSISNLDLNSNIITLTIASNPQTITLKKGEVKLIDLNSDGINDLQLTFVNTYVNRAEITAKAITSITDDNLASTSASVSISTSTVDAVINEEKKLTSKINKKLSQSLAGRILLQVEQKGQAWYVNPVSLNRYYLADGASAYQALRTFGLGIKSVDLLKIPIAKNSVTPADYINIKNPIYSQSLVNKLKGRIVIQVENHGEAWYINPVDGHRYYLANGDEAYQLMRNLSIGVTNDNIRKISVDILK